MAAGKQRGRKGSQKAQGGQRAAQVRRTVGEKRRGGGAGGASKGGRQRKRGRGNGAGRLPDGHIITLLQYRQGASSRTYTEHENMPAAMDSICQMFEQAIKMDVNASSDTARYTPADLWRFIDSVHDVGCLVYNTRIGFYKPHGREWIKQQLLEHLKGQVSAPGS